MGPRAFVAALEQSELWEVSAVYDISPPARQLARQNVPNAAVYEAPDPIFADPSIDVVGLFTLADARPQQIRQALACDKHVLAEKPLGADVATEWQLVREIEASDRFVAVNLFNRNAWYHKDIQRFIADGQIGDLAVIRVCHMTPGHKPMEGHDPEGPPFHDCGMHYVDVARWYANSEYQTWHAQGHSHVGLQGSLVGSGARHIRQRNRVRPHSGLRLRPPREAAAPQLLSGRDWHQGRRPHAA
jgi:predicted dehydrogenase